MDSVEQSNSQEHAGASQQKYTFEQIADELKLPAAELKSWLDSGEIEGIGPIESLESRHFTQIEFDLIGQYYVYLSRGKKACWKPDPTRTLDEGLNWLQEHLRPSASRFLNS